MLGNVALRARRCGGVRNAAKDDRGAVDGLPQEGSWGRTVFIPSLCTSCCHHHLRGLLEIWISLFVSLYTKRHRFHCVVWCLGPLTICPPSVCLPSRVYLKPHHIRFRSIYLCPSLTRYYTMVVTTEADLETNYEMKDVSEGALVPC